MSRTALVRAGNHTQFEQVLRSQGYLLVQVTPWRFSNGTEARWLGPDGTMVTWTEYTWLGRRGLRVWVGPEDAAMQLWTAFAEVLSLFDGAALYRAWQEALKTADAAAQLEAFLDFAAWAAMCDASESTTMRTPVFQAALDSADPVLRLAALRNLYVFTPDRAAVLLAGREDPENPGMAMWRQHYASLHAGRR